MPESSDPNGASDDFFIGWNPPPERDTRFARGIVIGVFGFLVLVGVGIALSQRSPGTGRWEDDRTITVEGIVYCRPYAMIRTASAGTQGGVRTVLLVEEGKFGAVERVKTFDGAPVRLRGTFLHRGDRWMVELSSSPDAIESITMTEAEIQRLRWPKEDSLGQMTLDGEIIDPKCYLGAMKPGDGKTHKACATLCISGGIPPMFVHFAENGPVYYLLVSRKNESAHFKVLRFVGEPVELSGESIQAGDLRILRLESVSRKLE